MKELIHIINSITKYGLDSNVNIQDKEKDLEENLVKLYAKSFEIQYEYDDSEYEDFDKKQFPEVIKHVSVNFKAFGYYHEVLNIEKVYEDPKNALGDAVDDLADIIYDLLEIKWRKENNSENDAWWFFELVFRGHTQAHLLGLLNYLKKSSE